MLNTFTYRLTWIGKETPPPNGKMITNISKQITEKSNTLKSTPLNSLKIHVFNFLNKKLLSSIV